jgi:hypothetical protein
MAWRQAECDGWQYGPKARWSRHCARIAVDERRTLRLKISDHFLGMIKPCRHGFPPRPFQNWIGVETALQTGAIGRRLMIVPKIVTLPPKI